MENIKNIIKKFKKELLITCLLLTLLIVSAIVLKEYLLLFLLAIAFVFYHIREQNKIDKNKEAMYMDNFSRIFLCYEIYFKKTLISFAEELQLRSIGLGTENFQIQKINHDVGRFESTMTFKAICKNICLSEKRIIEYQLAISKSAEMLILTTYNEKYNKNAYDEHFIYTTIEVASKNDMFIRFTINNNYIESL